MSDDTSPRPPNPSGSPPSPLGNPTLLYPLVGLIASCLIFIIFRRAGNMRGALAYRLQNRTLRGPGRIKLEDPEGLLGEGGLLEDDDESELNEEEEERDFHTELNRGPSIKRPGFQKLHSSTRAIFNVDPEDRRGSLVDDEEEVTERDAVELPKEVGSDLVQERLEEAAAAEAESVGDGRKAERQKR